ncbi:UDP-N-acetyl-D-glucosamine dehydrogenase [Sphaerisporangium krabiense]|uniref:Nucleotide sugar dehydrogenase n=1 Tax=Sphaerisporangium krabiense TaxID=763782 RepID=A0A7W9DUN5_9ACTN|nr:nucleotide sugar dehydrogenase [Sphaerisporangium krabiense]MBB5630580.1 nucleotide sugar dehydrogenase [Sphaerisporangium krabiense]GII62467.1 UDP-N-acetyl-D-glucosamine dehydrogenase [Sphaerisporangium krabiense]
MGDKLVVVGQGYVGLPLAMRAVEAGFDVVGIDVDAWRVKRLDAAESYIEDVGDDVLAEARRSGRYLPTIDYADAEGFDVCVITVPTPLREGVPDLRHITEAGRSIAPYVRPGATVVLESTTYPGTTDEHLRAVLEEGSELRTPEDFSLGYSPERIDPGNTRWRLENTPKVVSGVDAESLRKVRAFYERVVEHAVPVSSTRVAELCKLLENTFRHVNVALVNELSIFAAQLGIDVWEAIDAASTKPFGYMRFTPGPGVGGHCLPIDPSYLSWKVKHSLGHNFRFVELANDINDHMPDYVVHRLALALNRQGKPVLGSRVLALGLAYKKNTGDIRESPAIEVVKELLKLGAEVRVADPHVDVHPLPGGLVLVEATAWELAQADVVVVLTDHDRFDYELVERASGFVFDARNRCRGPNVERL